MSKFKFKLQKLLDIKIKEEEESKLKYINVQNQKRILEVKLENLESNYSKYSRFDDLSDIVEQKIRFNYLNSLTQSIKETNEALIKNEKKLEKAKADFIEKQIKRKSLETLKENELTRLKKEEERKEQIANDEFALYAYIRNKANVS